MSWLMELVCTGIMNGVQIRSPRIWYKEVLQRNQWDNFLYKFCMLFLYSLDISI